MSGDESCHGREPPYAPDYGQIDTKQSYATNYGVEQTTFPAQQHAQAYSSHCYSTQEGYRHTHQAQEVPQGGPSYQTQEVAQSRPSYQSQEVPQGGYTQEQQGSPYQSHHHQQAYTVQSQYGGGYSASQGYPRRDEAGYYSPYNTNVDARYTNCAPEQVMVRTGQAPERPDNYLCFAIFVTFFCCIPCGICGIIHATQVKGLWRDSEYEEARTASRLAKKWSIAGIIFSVLAWLIGGIIFALRKYDMLGF